jgi:hypothetical protein
VHQQRTQMVHVGTVLQRSYGPFVGFGSLSLDFLYCHLEYCIGKRKKSKREVAGNARRLRRPNRSCGTLIGVLPALLDGEERQKRGFCWDGGCEEHTVLAALAGATQRSSLAHFYTAGA